MSTGSNSDTPESDAKLLKVGLWFLGAVAGVSAPYILKAELAPSWIEWLIRGTGGEAQAWQAMGYICGVFGVIELLRWGGERYDKSFLRGAAAWLGLLLVAAFVVVAVGSVLLLGSFFLSCRNLDLT